MSEAHLVAVWGQAPQTWSTPVITADDLGFTRGDGCFETIRVLGGSPAQAANLDAHLARLQNSALALEISLPPISELASFVHTNLARWIYPGEAVLKLVVTRGTEWNPNAGPKILLTITAKPAPNPEDVGRQLRVTLLTSGRPSQAFKAAPWLLGGVKTLSYAQQLAALREAKRRGFDDAIMVSTDNYALEGTTSGILIAHHNQLFTTPTKDSGILESTLVKQIFAGAQAAGITCSQRFYAAEKLPQAQGVFLVSSSRGPCPVVQIDQHHLTPDTELVAKITAFAGF